MRYSDQNILTSILSRLNVKYTRRFAEKFYNEHPNKLNMLGLSQMLSYYHIENIGIKVAPDEKKKVLSELDTPYITFCGNYFAVIIKKTNQGVSYLWNGKRIETDIEQFSNIWSGEILIPEADTNSSEPNYSQNRKRSATAIGINILLAISLSLLGWILTPDNTAHLLTNIWYIIMLISTLSGIFICSLLIMKQMQIHNTYADKICTLLKNGDCNNILELDAAKWMGTISWSETGIGYFIGNLLILVYLPSLIPFMIVINILSLPYTLWSVWYQKTQAKQWCVLCLMVQAILWIAFLAGSLSGLLSWTDFNMVNLLFTFCIYSSSILIAHTIANNVTNKKLSEQTKQELNSLKASEGVLQALLTAQPHYPVSKETSKIQFGNKEADILITIFSNPHCNPCAQLHKKLDNILRNKESNLCIQFIFTSFNTDLESSSRALIDCYFKYPLAKAQDIYREWFNTGRFNKDVFFHKYNLANPDGDDAIAEFNKHTKWRKETQLHATPTILVNGYNLPVNYDITDIRYITNINI